MRHSFNFDSLASVTGSVILKSVCAETAAFPKLKRIAGDLDVNNSFIRHGLDFTALESIEGSFKVVSSHIKVNNLKSIGAHLPGSKFHLAYTTLEMDTIDFDHLELLGSDSVDINSNNHVSFKRLKEGLNNSF